MKYLDSSMLVNIPFNCDNFIYFSDHNCGSNSSMSRREIICESTHLSRSLILDISTELRQLESIYILSRNSIPKRSGCSVVIEK
jgi:hypothetical protein